MFTGIFGLILEVGMEKSSTKWGALLLIKLIFLKGFLGTLTPKLNKIYSSAWGTSFISLLFKCYLFIYMQIRNGNVYAFCNDTVAKATLLLSIFDLDIAKSDTKEYIIK